MLNLAIPSHPTFALLLEDIQDPGNLGSLLRTAAAAGVEVVWCSQGCTDAWSPKALRGGQGAHAILPIVERANLDEVVAQFTGQILAASPVGEAMYALNMQTPTAWMIGNEGAGLSEDLMAKASYRVAIPMPGKIESLNAAAAGAICLFEVVRQRSLV
jgi:TrmH family RNA methyltransferase